MAAEAGRMELSIMTKTTEIAGRLSPEKNGTIQFLGVNVNGIGWTDVFSFTYYLPPEKKFRDSVYHKGLMAYAEMVQRAEFSKTTGMIIYTDRFTLSHLDAEFSLESNPNVIFAVVDWPYFYDQRGITEGTIMRTMRYQAVDNFLHANIHVRDADTLFIAKMTNVRFSEIVIQWESAYLNSFSPKIVGMGYQILIGADYSYKGYYHKNLPYPVHFSFPFRQFEGHISNRPDPEKYLYVKTNELEWDNIQKDRDIYSSMFWRENLMKLPEAERRLLAKKASNEYISTIPPEKRRTDPFSSYFEEKYMYTPNIGVYAGFVSVFKDRTGIESFWSRCVNYIVTRYSMISHNGRRISTNELIQTFQNQSSSTNTSPIYKIGKDERMLIYAVIPEFLPKIFFFNIRYSRYIKESTDLSFFEPSYFNTYESRGGKHSKLLEVFTRHSDSYKKWIQEIYKKYPTEETFLNAINENTARRLVPYNTIQGKLASLPKSMFANLYHPLGNNFVRPYREYEKVGRATIRRDGAGSAAPEGGRRRRATRKQKSKGRQTRRPRSNKF